MPKVRVTGRALGLFSPQFVDLLISGDIQGQTEHFFEVLAGGNEGKGTFTRVELGATREGERGVLDVDGEIEAIDTFAVRIGTGAAADKLLPGKLADQDADRLLAHLHGAFERDLARFRRLTGY